MDFTSDTVQLKRADQLKRYGQFESDQKIPIFIACGIGSKARKPEAIYTLPLRFLKSNTATREDLEKYRKDVGMDFFYVGKGRLEVGGCNERFYHD